MIDETKFKLKPIEDGDYPYCFIIQIDPESVWKLDFYEDVHEPVYLWCIERFGDEEFGVGGRWTCRSLRFLFRDERDAFEFQMSWG